MLMDLQREFPDWGLLLACLQGISCSSRLQVVTLQRDLLLGRLQLFS